MLKKNIKGDMIIASVLSVITFVVFAPFASLGLDIHQSYMFKPALDVANGYGLFAETFTFYGALTTLLQTFAILLFGKTIWSINLMTVVFYSLITFIIYHIWIAFLPRSIAAFCCLIYVGLAPFYIFHFIPWSSVYSLFFVLFGYFLFMRFLTTENIVCVFFAGFLSSCAFWCRQPVGVFAFAAYMLFFIIYMIIRDQERKVCLKAVQVFILGFLVPSAVFILWLFFNAALKDWWLQSIVNAAGWNKEYGGLTKLWESLFVLEHGRIWILLPLFCLIVLIALLMFLYENRLDNTQKQRMISWKILLSFSLICLASWLQYYPVPCLRHVYWAAIPMIGLFSYGVLQIIQRFKVPLRPGMKIGIVILILCYVFSGHVLKRARAGIARYKQEWCKMEEPYFIRGMKIHPKDAEGFERLNEFIGANAAFVNSSGIIVKPEVDPMYLAILPRFPGAQNEIRVLFLNMNGWGNMNTYPSRDQEVELFIQKRKPVVFEGINNKETPCSYKIMLNIAELGIKVLLPQ